MYVNMLSILPLMGSSRGWGVRSPLFEILRPVGRSQDINVPPQQFVNKVPPSERAIYCREDSKFTAFQLECLLWGIYLKRRIRHKQTALCTKIFIAALSVVVKTPNRARRDLKGPKWELTEASLVRCDL